MADAKDFTKYNNLMASRKLIPWSLAFPFPSLLKLQDKIIKESIDTLLEKNSVIVVSPNGTGKTASAITVAISLLEWKKIKKCYIVSRTHRQISHYFEALNLINDNRNRLGHTPINAVEWASRDMLCINNMAIEMASMTRSKNEKTIDFACQTSQRHSHNFEDWWCQNSYDSEDIIELKDDLLGDEPALCDVDHLKAFGIYHELCPYRQSRLLEKQYQLILANYNYFFDPFLLKILQIDLTGCLLIVDECLTGDTIITMKNGSCKQIKDIVDGDEVVGGIVSNTFMKKVNTVIEIKTTFGTLSSSETHPNLAIKEKTWDVNLKKYVDSAENNVEIIKSKDLEIGNLLLVPCRIPHETIYQYTPEELYFIAIVLCDGHLDKDRNSQRTKFELHNKDKVNNYELSFQNILEKIDPSAILKTKETNRTDIKNHTNYYSKLIWSNSEKIRSFLKEFNVPTGKKSNIIDISEKIFHSPLNSISKFIQGCFDAEGWVLEQHKCVSFSSTSKQFISKIKLLLLKFGIKSTIVIKKRKNEKHAMLFHINITGKDILAFEQYIGFSINYKKEKLNNIITGITRNSSTKQVTWNNMQYFLVPITDIQKIEKEDFVYDFTTTCHYFIANGILTHNCHNLPGVIESALRKEIHSELFRHLLNNQKKFSFEIQQFIEKAFSFFEKLCDHLKSHNQDITFEEFGDMLEQCHISSTNVDEFQEKIQEALKRNSKIIGYMNALIAIGSFFTIYTSFTQEAFVCYYHAYGHGKYRKEIVGILSLDISPVIQMLMTQKAQFLFMTGTLEPDLFCPQLGLTKGINTEVLIYKGDKRKLQVYCYERGVEGSLLNSMFENRKDENMVKDYGMTIQRLIRHIPNGSIIFFPTYKVKDGNKEKGYEENFVKQEGWIDVWKRHRIITEINNKLYFRAFDPTDKNKAKEEYIPIFNDEGDEDSTAIIDAYKEEATKSKAVLLACYRSRASEGEDYPDNQARSIFILGYPIADISQAAIKRKMEFLNKKKQGYGSLWLRLDAVHAVNQACGRLIRNPMTDFGTIHLFDSRYISDLNIFSRLSDWLRECIMPNIKEHTPEKVGSQLDDFYSSML